MYVKCGELAKANTLIDGLAVARDVFLWTALISGYVQQGQGQDALKCFEQMQHDGLSLDAVAFASVLKACGSVGAIDKGTKIHDEIAKQGLLRNNIKLGTALVSMYAKCGALTKAQQVLEELPARDVVSWSALIAGYAQEGQGEMALNCFEQMKQEGFSPDTVTFACILKACGSIGAVDIGEKIHDEISKEGLLGSKIMLGNALVDMYAKCGALAKAQQVFEELPARDVVSWNALIAGYAQHGQGQDALKCFKKMKHEGYSPDAVTFSCILKACGSIGAIDMGEEIHKKIAREGLLVNNTMLGIALADMYAKCGALLKAEQVVKGLPARNVVAWSALIAGYVQQGQGEEALSCFERMQCEGLSPDAMTFACILKACGSIGAIDKGIEIHDEIAKQELLEKDIVLGNALVDMYAKCGALAKAQQVLENLPDSNVVSWTSLIAGYAQQGQSKEAISCFERMQSKDVSPNAATLSSVLNACSHSGLVDEGQVYFANMSTIYGIDPDFEHYACMVDLLGRAGHLDEAVRMIEKMPCSDNSIVWTALLGACRKWQDVKVGKWAFENAVQVDKSDAVIYVLMANIYTGAGMHEDAKKIGAMRVENKAFKNPGRNLWVH